MKKTYKLAMAVASAAMTVGAAGSALAFHDGGVARCNGCHTMHNSELNTPIDGSSACLNCHGSGTDNHSYHVYTEGADINISMVPQQYGPGGDFAWLVFVAGGSGHEDRRGHNINAQEFGIIMDDRLTQSPGGTYPADQLACSSCHDPHGRYRVIGGTTAQVTEGAPIAESGSYGADPAALLANEAMGVYRLLGGVGYIQKSTATTADAFVNPAPIAVAPANYNDPNIEGGVRVAYGQGMSEWCANCHGNMHNDDYPNTLRHPAGNNAKLGTVIAGNYNAYVTSGINTGDQSSSYLALVSFETGKDYTDIPGLVAEQGSVAGPDATANVMCLSGFSSMMRWNYGASPFLVNGTDEYVRGKGLTQEQTDAAYYNLPASTFGRHQRSLCNKCHAKD